MEAGLPDHHVEAEIDGQPSCRREAARLPDVRDALPRDGERVAVFGCDTSLYTARAHAALREAKGHGLTGAFPASEFPLGEAVPDRARSLTRSVVLP